LVQRKSRGDTIGGLQPAGLQAIFASESGEDAVRQVGLAGGVPSPYIAFWLGTENVLKWIPSIGGLGGLGTA